ncbi:hypothetical protein AMTRI_Chr13g118010 [Amborella trichopoda]
MFLIFLLLFSLLAGKPSAIVSRLRSMVSRSFKHLAPSLKPHIEASSNHLFCHNSGHHFRPNQPKHARKPFENRWKNHSRCCCDFSHSCCNGVPLKGSGCLKLFLAANSGTKVGVSTSSDVLYLDIVNVVSPCQKNIDSP